VKLPKSFLAVNLSETHTFHKKEEHDENSNSSSATANFGMEKAGVEDKGTESSEAIAGNLSHILSST
jgi:hypothetical protein